MAGMYFMLGLLLICGFAAIIGIVEARMKRRNAQGWIVSIVVSIVGAVCGGLALSAVVDATGFFRISEPAFDVVLLFAAMALGAWLSLQLVNRFR